MLAATWIDARPEARSELAMETSPPERRGWVSVRVVAGGMVSHCAKNDFGVNTRRYAGLTL